jgi:phage tail tape measure protein, TP901 family
MAKELLVGVVVGATLKAGFTTVFGRAEKAAKALGDEIKNATRANEAFGRAIRARIALNPTRELSGQSRAFAAMTVQIDRATRAQNNLNRAIAGQKAATEHRRQLRSDMVETAGHGMVLAAPIIGSVRKFMEQEAASADLKISMMRQDGSFGRFEEIDRLATQWGAALPGNKTDFTQMALGLKSQGISDATIINGGGLATARLNTVMGIPVADGSFFAKNMEAHGIKESELLQSADLTQRAYFAAGLTKEDMYQAMAYYAPKVNTLGMTGLENQKQIYAVEGLSANKGLEGSSFGTNFSMMLSQLSKGPQMIEMATRGMKAETREMLEASGAKFEFFNKNGSMKSLREITGELERGFGQIRAKYGDKGVMDVADAMFGQEGGRVASILGQAGLKGFDAMTAKMEQQASLDDRIKVKTGTLSASIEALGGTVENTAASFGEVFAPDIKAFAEQAQNTIDQYVMPFISQHKTAIKVVTGFVLGLFAVKLAGLAAAYGLSLMFSPVRSLWIGFRKFQALRSLFGLFRLRGLSRSTALLRAFGVSSRTAARAGTLIGRVSAPISAVFTKIGAAPGVLGKLSTAFGMAGRGVLMLGQTLLTTPIGWMVLAIATAAFLIYKYWGPIKSFFTGVWEGIKEGFAPAMPILEGFWNGLKELGQAAAEVFAPLLNWLGEFFTANTEGSAAAQSFGQMVGTVLGGFLAGVVQTGAMIVDGWRMIFDTLFGAVDAAWTEIKTAFSGGLTGILGLILNWSPLGAFYTAFATVLSWFGIELPAKFTEFGSNIISGLWNGLKAKFEEVKAWFTGVASWFSSKFQTANQIHSPSRLFKRFGGWMMEGLHIGLNRGSARPLATIGGVASDLQQRFSSRSGSLSAELAASMRANADEFAAARSPQAGGGVTVHFNPTINAPGGDPNQIQAALQIGLREFEQLFERLMADRARRAY